MQSTSNSKSPSCYASHFPRLLSPYNAVSFIQTLFKLLTLSVVLVGSRLDTTQANSIGNHAEVLQASQVGVAVAVTSAGRAAAVVLGVGSKGALSDVEVCSRRNKLHGGPADVTASEAGVLADGDGLDVVGTFAIAEQSDFSIAAGKFSSEINESLSSLLVAECRYAGFASLRYGHGRGGHEGGGEQKTDDGRELHFGGCWVFAREECAFDMLNS